MDIAWCWTVQRQKEKQKINTPYILVDSKWKLGKDNMCRVKPFFRSALGTIELQESPIFLCHLSPFVRWYCACSSSPVSLRPFQTLLHQISFCRYKSSSVRVGSINSLHSFTWSDLLHYGGETELSDPSPSVSPLSEVMRRPALRSGNSLVRCDHFSNCPKNQTPMYQCQSHWVPDPLLTLFFSCSPLSANPFAGFKWWIYKRLPWWKSIYLAKNKKTKKQSSLQAAISPTMMWWLKLAVAWGTNWPTD